MADRVIELHAKGRTASQTLPYDAMDVQAWHRRTRVVYTPPQSLLASYQPLVSATFAKLCQAAAGDVTEDGPVVTPVGDLGLGLALNEDRQPVVPRPTARRGSSDVVEFDPAIAPLPASLFSPVW